MDPQRLWREDGSIDTLTPVILIFQLLALRIMTEEITIILSHQVCGNFQPHEYGRDKKQKLNGKQLGKTTPSHLVLRNNSLQFTCA